MNVIQLQAGDYVLLRKQGHLAADESSAIEHGIALRDQLTPLVTRGILEINLKDAPLGRLPVGAQVELVTSEVGVERRVYIVHYRNQRALLDQVLNVHLGLGRGGAIENDDLEIMPIVTDVDADALVLAIALAKDLGGRRNVDSQFMEEHPRTFRQ